MSARSDSRFRTRSASVKRSLSFRSPCASIVSPPRLSPPQADSTDRVLTFLQSARDRNVPVRSGKWSPAEDAYLAKLVWLFTTGVLADMEPKTSLRSFLANMLNCCPMRISKKQMNGHTFMGKIKYVPQGTTMTPQHYESLCHEVQTLRDDFLQAWAKDEYARRSSTVKVYDTSFQDWYDKVVALVPTPQLVQRSSLKCNKKRRIESVDTVPTQVHDSKMPQAETMATVCTQHENPEQEGVKKVEPAEMVPLEPTPVVEAPVKSKVIALPTAYCSETLSLGDWLDPCHADAHWIDSKSGNPGEAWYTLREDQVQVSVHRNDLEPMTTELSMTRRSSKLIIDFGAPSCWFTGEEPKPFTDDSQWSENAFSDDLVMATECGMFNWDDALPLPHVTNSPTMSFP